MPQDPYYEMIAEEQKRFPGVPAQAVRIMVNDCIAESGYIPNLGHRKDDADFPQRVDAVHRTAGDHESAFADCMLKKRYSLVRLVRSISASSITDTEQVPV